MGSIDFRALRAQVSMHDVLELLGFESRSRQGDQIRGPCPIHGSSSPTSRVFSANLIKNVFQCFRCGAQGNQLELWAQIHGLPIYEASLDLCQKLSVDPPVLRR